MSQFFVDYYFLAEKIYARELSFIRDRHTIIENKAQINFTKEKFIFRKESGTSNYFIMVLYLLYTV